MKQAQHRVWKRGQLLVNWSEKTPSADSVSAWVVFGEVRCHFGAFLMNLNQHFLDFQLLLLPLKISINLI